jgi:nucleosome binding factor SPN SPT16 subunit
VIFWGDHGQFGHPSKYAYGFQVVDFVKEKDESLVEKLTKNFGFVMGIEFREGSLLINRRVFHGVSEVR